MTDTVCRSRKNSYSGVGDLHTRGVSARSGPQNGVLGVYPLGGEKFGSWRVLNRDCRGDEEEESSPSRTDWWVVWHCHAGREIDSFSSLSDTSDFVALTALHILL